MDRCWDAVREKRMSVSLFLDVSVCLGDVNIATMLSIMDAAAGR